MSKSKKPAGSGSRTLIVVVILLALICILLMVGVLYYFLVYAPAHETKGAVGGKREAAALEGTLQILTEEELQAELNKIVDEGMFRISIASRIVGFDDGMAEVRIENNMTNRYLMQVDIILDDTGEVVYSTDLIDPGYYIQEAQLDVPLPMGEYPATAVFTALYPDNGEIVGTAGAQVEFVILASGTTPTPEPTATPSPSPTPDPSMTPDPSASPDASESPSPSPEA